MSRIYESVGYALAVPVAAAAYKLAPSFPALLHMSPYIAAPVAATVTVQLTRDDKLATKLTFAGGTVSLVVMATIAFNLMKTGTGISKIIGAVLFVLLMVIIIMGGMLASI